MILAASFGKDGEDPPGTAHGVMSPYYGDRKVGQGRIKTQAGKFSIAGEGLHAGRDSGESVTDDYPGSAPWAFTGGTLKRVSWMSAANPTSTSNAKPSPCSPANDRCQREPV